MSAAAANAVAESLVDRIGAEIDKRIDARLRTGSSGSRPPAESSQSGKGQAPLLGVGIGAGLGAAVVNRYRNMSAKVRATSTFTD